MNAAGRAMALASFVVIVGVNVLVLAKYGPRAGWSPMSLAIAYSGIVAVGALVARRRGALSPRASAAVFWAVVAVAALGSLVLLDRVPAQSVRVDRWSAITSFNDRLLAGQYPYEARTHLGSRVSGLPALFALGLPFQWAGDVGYLQVFVLVAFATICQRQWGRRFTLAWPMLLLVASPAYAWEVAVRSDLASNGAVAVMFLFLCERWRGGKTPGRMAAVGALGGLVASTRLVLAVPMLAYFVGYFDRDERTAATVSACAALATFAATLAPFVIWSPRLFLENNPLSWQASLAPTSVQVAAVAASVVAGARAKGLAAKCGAGGLIVGAAALATFLFGVSAHGFDGTLRGGLFDISYFDLALPFLAVPLLFAFPIPGEQDAPAARPGLASADGGR
jgi:hypothetical protein